MQQRIQDNNAARAAYLDDIVGSPEDIEALRSAKRVENNNLTAIAQGLRGGGPNKFGMTLKPLLKHLNDVAKDRTKNLSEGFPEEMAALRQRLFAPPKEPKPAGKLSDLLDMDYDPTEENLYRQLAASEGKSAPPN